MTVLFPRLRFADGRLALAVGERELSYRALARACAAHAASLTAAGVGPGDRVAVWAAPSLDAIVAMVAQAASGVVTVPLNPKLGSRELAHVLTDAAPRCILAPAAQAGAVAARVDACEVRAIDALDAPPAGTPPAPFAHASPDDAPCFVLYTSGTTGAPKGAALTGANVAANIDALAEAFAWTDTDTVVHALPLFHVHGLLLGVLGSLRVGGATRYVPHFEPAAVAAAMRDGGTMLFAVPTMYRRLADAAEADAAIASALSGARMLVSGSAGMTVREHARLRALLGRGVYERYGLTETLINTAVPASRAPQPGTVGWPLRGVELRVVDEARRPLDAARDTLGEVAVRGPSVFAGYLNRPDATAAVRDAQGWFYTGDLATLRDDGAVQLAGRRATDLIKTGGFKVGAGEIEAVLLDQPGVSEAAVLGAPDPDLGERIVAFVVPRDPAAPPDAAALIEAVARELAPHKRPRDVVFLAALPRNAMGKVQKQRLAAGETPGSASSVRRA
ncbi:MAG: AMP-binding protein [Myxococcales bacterium]|nr:AMP-binding protein [Myxococcales bacterium]